MPTQSNTIAAIPTASLHPPRQNAAHGIVKAAEPKTFIRLLLDLIGQVISLIAPIALVAVLPLRAGFGLVAATAIAAGLCARLTWKKFAIRISHVLSGLIIGLALSLLLHLPSYWNVAAGLFVFLGGLAAQGTWERRQGLMSAKPEPRRVPDDPRSPRGASAWGGGAPRRTPEGEPIRILDVGEIAMGGPTYCDYLFPDGVLLCGMGTSACFSTDARYFAAPLPSRQTWGLAILDRHERRLYYCSYSAFWELDEFTPDALRGRDSPLVSNQSTSVPLAALLASAEVCNLIPICDLWLTPDWQERIARTERDLPAPPMGHHRARARLFLPPTLRDLDDPLVPLRYPGYTLEVDDQSTGLLIGADTPIVWRADGQALCCAARPTCESARKQDGPYWLWEAGTGWRSLPLPWIRAEAEPDLTYDEPVALDSTSLRITARLNLPELSHGRHGTQLHNIHGDIATLTGYTPEGRMQIGELKRTELQLDLPLDSQGGRGAAAVETLPLENGLRARLQWRFDRDDGLGVHACRIGDWRLPGDWLLDHRVSDCGRYIALIPAPDNDAVPGEVVVADVRLRTLIRSAPMLVARLQDFRQGVLSLAEIRGRQDENAHATALRRFQEAAPPPAQAAAFLAPRPASRLFYQQTRLAVRLDSLAPLPDWRIVDRPQLAIADGDFIYPAPHGKDAAWFFGSTTEYDDGWLRENTPRRNGYLLSASGCALGGLAPTMIWSTDGRYLALTRMSDERDASGQWQWQLLLLDPAAERLHTLPEPIGRMPRFERFDDDGLRLRTFKHDWLVDGDPGHRRHLSMATLLALPCVALVRHETLMLEPEQEKHLALWEAWDRGALRQWR